MVKGEDMVRFVQTIWFEMHKDRVLSLANEMTYKGLMASFPFIIFLMSLLGYANIDGRLLLTAATPYLAPQILDIFTVFIEEVLNERHVTVLSISLLVAVFSASSGFRAIIRGLNQSYGISRGRGFFGDLALSLVLVPAFALLVTISLAVFTFGDTIQLFIHTTLMIEKDFGLINLLMSVGAMALMLFSIMFIYKVALATQTRFWQHLPGAVFTLILWLAACKLFNIYVNNFSRFGKMYGSVAGIFILLIWLNIISVILLIGSEINAILAHKPQFSKHS